MIETSALFDEKIKESGRSFRIKMLHEGVEVDGDFRGLVVNKGACGVSAFDIGTVFSSYIEATLHGCPAALENKEILLQLGLVLDDNSEEYVNVGYFTVTKPKTTAYQTSFTAVGRISAKLNTYFTAPEVQMIENIANAITEATGVPVVFKGLTASGTIEKSLEGLTCKEVLQAITSVLGGFATEDSNGNIVISKFSTENRIDYDGDSMTRFPQFNDYDYSLDGVKVIVSDETKDEDGNATEEVSFTSGTPRITIKNPYMTEELFESFAQNVVGYTFRPGTVPIALGDPRLEPWDCLEVTDVKGNVYIVPCLNIVHSFDGGLSTTITAPGNSESEDEATVKGPITQQIERMSYELLTAKDAIFKRVRADELESEVGKFGYLKADELSAEVGTFNFLTAAQAQATYATIQTLEAEKARISTLESTTVKTAELEAKVGTFGYLKTDELETEVATFGYLKSANLSAEVAKLNYATIDSLNATTAKITALESTALKVADLSAEVAKLGYATVGNLDAAVARIGTLETTSAKIADLEVLTANFNSLNAKAITTDNFSAKIAEFKFLTAEEAALTYATIEKLQSDYATLSKLESEYATISLLESDYATIANLSAATGRIGTLEADNATIKGRLSASEAKIGTVEAGVADINTLMFGSAAGTTLTTEFANTLIAVVGTGQIKNAMIDTLEFSKITGVDINTKNILIHSDDGKSQWKDNTIQISDASRVRVQIGKDAVGDYNMYVWDASGKLMFDATGLKADGIQSAIIRNDMVAANANIDGSKLNIQSVVKEIDDSSYTLKSSHLLYDGKSLDLFLGEISETVTEHGTNITSQGTQITTLQGKFDSKIWMSDVNTATNTMNNKYTSLEQNLNSFKTTVADTYYTSADATLLNNKVNGAVKSIERYYKLVDAGEAVPEKPGMVKLPLLDANTGAVSTSNVFQFENADGMSSCLFGYGFDVDWFENQELNEAMLLDCTVNYDGTSYAISNATDFGDGVVVGGNIGMAYPDEYPNTGEPFIIMWNMNYNEEIDGITYVYCVIALPYNTGETHTIVITKQLGDNDWTTTEPATVDSTKALYYSDLITYVDGATEYTDVLKSGSYDATIANYAAITVESNKITQQVASTYSTKAELDAAKTDISSAQTLATQTANKFNWLVASGNSATDFTLTDRTATLIAEKINLQGLVSFSGLNSSVQAKLNDAVSVKNDISTRDNQYGLKYALDVVVYGDSNKFYPVIIKYGDQNVKRTILVKRGYNEQAPADWNSSTHMGGLTLKLRTNFGGWGGANYSWIVDEFEEMYSQMFGGAVNCGANTQFAIFLRGGGTTGAKYHLYSDQPLNATGGYDYSLDSNGNPVANGLPSPQITYNSDLCFCTSNAQYKYYAPAPRTMLTGYNNDSTKYKRATAQEEEIRIRNYVVTSKTSDSKLASWCAVNDTTLIDGGMIYTGSITTDKLAANAVTAAKINVGDLQSNLARVGNTNGKHLLLNSSGVNIKDSTSVLASFTANKIELGKNNTNSIIDLCSGSAELKVKEFNCGGTGSYFTLNANKKLAFSADNNDYGINELAFIQLDANVNNANEYLGRVYMYAHGKSESQTGASDYSYISITRNSIAIASLLSDLSKGDVELDANTNVTGTLTVNDTNVSLEGHEHYDMHFTKSEINSKLAGYSLTSHTHAYAASAAKTATVLGASKNTEVIGSYQAVFPNGAIFSGSAAAAGLVTRGICGVTSPDSNGTCSKDNLYINYDSDNTYRSTRHLILQAGSAGTHYGSNLYQYAAARGDAVKAWVEAKGYVTSSHTHNYAGSTAAGGDANNALKLGGLSLASGYNVKGRVANIGSDGVMEVGQYIDFHINDTTTDYSARLAVDSSGKLTMNGSVISVNGHKHNNITSADGSYLITINSSGHLVPNAPGDQHLGLTNYRWDGCYLSVSPNVSSDARFKKNFNTDFSKYIAMLDYIEPESYNLIENDEKRHTGYVAQKVEKAMKQAGLAESDFAGLRKDFQDGDYIYSLHYEEFIPILHAKIKQLEREIKILKSKAS